MNKYDLVEGFWVGSPKAFEERMKEIVDTNPQKIDFFELCKTSLGWKVLGFRMGRGSRNVFLLGCQHGAEPAGTFGLAALIEGLAEARIPGSDLQFPLAEKILKHFTLYMFPLLNPDGAKRLSMQVKDSFIASQFLYSLEDSEKFEKIHSEPGITLGRGRPPHFSDEEMEAWRKTGKPIGTLFTEDGVELWMDWEYEKAPQTRALKKLMHIAKPSLFVDTHQHSASTALYMPAEMDEEALTLHRHLGSFLYDRLEEASITFIPSRQVQLVAMKQWSGMTSIHWLYETFGRTSYQYLYEIDSGWRWYNPKLKPEEVKLPSISKAQIIMAVWYGITALLKGILEEHGS